MSDYSLSVLSLRYQGIPYTAMVAADHPDRAHMPSGAFHCLQMVPHVQWVFMESGYLIGCWNDDTREWEMHHTECLQDIVDWRLNTLPREWIQACS